MSVPLALWQKDHARKYFSRTGRWPRGASRFYKASPPFVKIVPSATTLLHLPVEQPCPVFKQWAGAALSPAWKELSELYFWCLQLFLRLIGYGPAPGEPPRTGPGSAPVLEKKSPSYNSSPPPRKRCGRNQRSKKARRRWSRAAPSPVVNKRTWGGPPAARRPGWAALGYFYSRLTAPASSGRSAANAISRQRRREMKLLK